MVWFRCFIRGENFPGQLIGEPGPIGFYVTRFVEATETEAAEAQALDTLRSEPKLSTPPGFTPNGQSKIFFEEIAKVDASQVPGIPPGFAWYPMAASDTEPSIRVVDER
jgi:hypothetical protein